MGDLNTHRSYFQDLMTILYSVSTFPQFKDPQHRCHLILFKSLKKNQHRNHAKTLHARTFLIFILISKYIYLIYHFLEKVFWAAQHDVLISTLAP